MKAAFSENKMHKIRRICQTVRDYFEANWSVSKVAAKGHMIGKSNLQ